MWHALVLEVVGLALVVAFFWFVWPPLTLLVAGVLLVAVAVVAESRAKPVPDAEEAP
jgi:hypothetical protein